MGQQELGDVVEIGMRESSIEEEVCGDCGCFKIDFLG